MKAQIFSLPDQEHIRRTIESVLRSDFYPNIMIEHVQYDDRDKAAARRTGGSYLELMRATTVRVGDFTIDAEDNDGNWGYYWDDNLEGKFFLRLGQDLRPKVFPSVAIMSRMVMVPFEIHQAIDAPADFSYLFKPLGLQGVLLVDFSDPQALRSGVVRVATQLRTEIISLGRRHMSVQGTRAPDLEDLSQLLDVNLEFLESLRPEIVEPLPRLVSRVTSEPVRLGRESPVTLEIRNEADDAPGIVRVQVRAPAKVMPQPLVRYVDFSAGKVRQQTIEFKATPRAAPYCPLEVLLLLNDSAHDPIPPTALILEVADSEH